MPQIEHAKVTHVLMASQFFVVLSRVGQVANMAICCIG
jgi:hypothetical protein